MELALSMEDGKKVGLFKNRCYMETVKTSVVGFYKGNICGGGWVFGEPAW